ncbi:MAG: type I DNA topoisomerase [Actinomycetota bacterium]|nr:type I DNA topoisomerase [Actinomycetota bacterium]
MVVESPAKARTIEKYLGKDFKVLASIGHVRDLPLKSLGVDVEHDFKLEYLVNEDKKKVISQIAKAAKNAEEVYLATDYDREGEAIAWHITEACKIPAEKQRRVTFTEITKKAISDAITHPRSIDQRLVDAQQARRSIDRLVGYPVSQLVWQKIRYGLSAGRVQSPALRLVVEREREIRSFVPVEYWTLQALLATQEEEEFTALLVQIGSSKVPTKISKDSSEDLKNRIPDAARAHEIARALEGASWRVQDVRTKQTSRTPAPPFVTSTFQMEASRKLGLSSRRAMNYAQQLYEAGLITYMRTDSTSMSTEAIRDAAKLVKSTFGEAYWAGRYKHHDRKAKGAQEAHECIRPTEMGRVPKELENEIRVLSSKEGGILFRVYELIWKRAVASLMSPALFDQVSADVVATPASADHEPHIFRGTGSTMKFDGFIRLYKEGRDDDSEDDEARLPNLNADQPLELRELRPEQHFTQPPPRYTEASLIKELEARGIGRPSTYASIISTLLDEKRDFTRVENKRLAATDTGEVTNDFLIRYFGDHFMDYEFTSDMEERLDQLAEGKLSYRPVVESFYIPMQDRLNKAGEVPKQEVTTETTEERCPNCGNPLVIKLGRRGKFYGCSTYPNCDYTRPVPGQQEPEPEVLDEKCPNCGSPLQRKRGRFGPFVGCSNYPDCKYIQKNAARRTGFSCPRCAAEPCKRCVDGEVGELVERRGRKGLFFGCSHYPACRHTQNENPAREPADVGAAPSKALGSGGSPSNNGKK